MLRYMVATAASSAVNRTHTKETIFLFSSGFGAQRLSFELKKNDLYLYFTRSTNYDMI